MLRFSLTNHADPSQRKFIADTNASASLQSRPRTVSTPSISSYSSSFPSSPRSSHNSRNTFSYYAMSDMTSGQLPKNTSPQVPSIDVAAKKRVSMAEDLVYKNGIKNNAIIDAFRKEQHHAARRTQSDTLVQAQDHISRGLGFAGGPDVTSAASMRGTGSGPDITICRPSSNTSSNVNSRSTTPHLPLGGADRTRPHSEILMGQALFGPGGGGGGGSFGMGGPNGNTPARPSPKIYINATSHDAGASRAGHALSPEAGVIDRWFDDLGHYDRTLDQMAHTQMDNAFLEELRAMVTWFQAISDCERTTAVYSLLHHLNPVQVRFFVTVLKQMQKSDPLSSLMEGGVGGQSAGRFQERPASAAPMDPRLNHRKSTIVPMMSGGIANAFLAQPMASERYRRHSSDNMALRMAPSAAPSCQQQQRPIGTGQKADAASHWRPNKPRSQVGSPTSTAFAPLPISAPTTSGRPNLMNITASTTAAMGMGGGPPSPVPYSPLSLVPPPQQMSWGSRRNSQDSLNAAAMSAANENHRNNSRRPSYQGPGVDAGKRDHRVGGGDDTLRRPSYHGHVGDAGKRDYRGGEDATRSRPSYQGHMGDTGKRDHRVGEEQQRGDRYRAGGGGHFTVIPQSNGGHRASVASEGGGSDVDSQGRRKSRVVRDKGKIPEKINLKICEHIPTWLRSLRLHKYTSIFENSHYLDMIKLDDEGLEKVGVSALGARRKMLKVFEAVRDELAARAKAKQGE